MSTTFTYKSEYLNTINAPVLLRAYLSLSKRNREILTKTQLIQLLTSFKFTQEESSRLDKIFNQNSRTVRVKKYSYQANRSVMINPPPNQHIFGVITGNAYTDHNLRKITITNIIDNSPMKSANVLYKGLVVFCDKNDIEIAS